MAAVSYSDHMLGQALDLLEELGSVNSTVVVFHSVSSSTLSSLSLSVVALRLV